MPMYQYRCEKCNEEFEAKQSISDDPIKDCPKCKGSVYRVIAPVGISFKGNGFHVNDYQKGSSCPSGNECGSKNCPAK